MVSRASAACAARRCIELYRLHQAGCNYLSGKTRAPQPAPGVSREAKGATRAMMEPTGTRAAPTPYAYYRGYWALDDGTLFALVRTPKHAMHMPHCALVRMRAVYFFPLRLLQYH